MNETDTLIAILNNDVIRCTKCGNKIALFTVPFLNYIKLYDNDTYEKKIVPKFLCDECVNIKKLIKQIDEQ